MKKALFMLAVIGSVFVMSGCAKEEGSKSTTTTTTQNDDGSQTKTQATTEVTSTTK